jgi:hypothetical protein
MKKFVKVMVSLLVVVGVLVPAWAVSALEVTVDITGKTCEQIESGIQAALDNGDDVVVVGTKTDGDEGISIDIPDGISVEWQADYKAQIDGDIAVEIFSSTGGLVLTGSIEVSGENSTAIWGRAAYITIDGGAVKAFGENSVGAVSSYGRIEVFDGSSIQADGKAIVAYDESVVIIWGGMVKGGQYSIHAYGEPAAPALALYYAGAVSGRNYVEMRGDEPTGAIYKIKSYSVLAAWDGTDKGVELVSGGDSEFEWITDGANPVFEVTNILGTISVDWGEYVDRLAGDVNGDDEVTIADAVLVLRFVCVGDKAVTFNEDNADCDGEDGISAGDAFWILCWVTRTMS